MVWCFSTRASVATVLSTHPCVSSCLGVYWQSFCQQVISWMKFVIFWLKFQWNFLLKILDNKSALVQIMAWHQTGSKSLSEPMLVYFTDLIVLLHLNHQPAIFCAVAHKLGLLNAFNFSMHNSDVVLTANCGMSKLMIQGVEMGKIHAIFNYYLSYNVLNAWIRRPAYGMRWHFLSPICLHTYFRI